MNQSPLLDYTDRLQQLMQLIGVSSFKALSQKAGVSERQIKRLRRGEVMQMQVETILKLSSTLQMPLKEFLAAFSASSFQFPESSDKSTALEQEYQRLQKQLAEQKLTLEQEFQQKSLQTLESWLIQWPTAAYAAQQNPEKVSSVKLLPLLRPVEQLLREWGVEAIASVGAELPFDPQQHQLREGVAQPGDLVKVSHVGYRQGDKLLYRAKVKPIFSVK
ncbi:helix-turn-helix domain-containing protein [Phormidium sp. LEGE 05292]|uniref:helix-turn-helix domain-containing protein n=1 Tax=[Phormidium] sp. LEGE 05292 TaxID=767427 RepID=UPI00187E5E19|nr:helix-turn-helix domain-containing protein [Phormidium sp. LEGE 05292]MBE9228332.1 helix-turn-helix domain-containing protein [Phormidium sp. LEGE 05292]